MHFPSDKQLPHFRAAILLLRETVLRPWPIRNRRRRLVQARAASPANRAAWRWPVHILSRPPEASSFRPRFGREPVAREPSSDQRNAIGLATARRAPSRHGSDRREGPDHPALSREPLADSRLPP